MLNPSCIFLVAGSLLAGLASSPRTVVAKEPALSNDLAASQIIERLKLQINAPIESRLTVKDTSALQLHPPDIKSPDRPSTRTKIAAANMPPIDFHGRFARSAAELTPKTKALLEQVGLTLIDPGPEPDFPLPPSVSSDIGAAVALGAEAEAQKDYDEAMFWYRLAAAKGDGDVNAIYRIGLFYQNGWGVSTDRDQARYWFRLASEMGNEDAEKALRQLDALPKRVQVPQIMKDPLGSPQNDERLDKDPAENFWDKVKSIFSTSKKMNCKQSPIKINFNEIRGESDGDCLEKRADDPSSNEILYERRIKLLRGLIDVVWHKAGFGGHIRESPINNVLSSRFGNVLNKIDYIETRGKFNANGRSYEVAAFSTPEYRNCMGFVNNGNMSSNGLGFDSRIYGFYCRTSGKLTNQEFKTIVQSINVQN
jgi:Sel1 repeat